MTGIDYFLLLVGSVLTILFALKKKKTDDARFEALRLIVIIIVGIALFLIIRPGKPERVTDPKPYKFKNPIENPNRFLDDSFSVEN